MNETLKSRFLFLPWYRTITENYKMVRFMSRDIMRNIMEPFAKDNLSLMNFYA